MFLHETFVFSQKTIHMRHIHFLLAGFLLCICCTLQAKNRVIDQPPFIVRNTTSIEVSKVVISDTATVLHIYAKYRPKYWIQIAPDSYLTDNNGETYQLRSGIGIIPGKEFWMPESGEAEFQLVFPPLSDNATSFDFTEGEKVENGFSIWGIQLKSKKLPELALPQNAVVHKADPNAELPEPVIQYGKAMLKGKLLDSRPNMGMPISIAVWENIKGDITDIPLDIQPDGSFTKEVTLPGTTPCTIYLGREHMLQFFMEPGKTTEIYVNLREASRRKSKFHSEGKPYGEMVYINGPLETVAQELNGNHLSIDMQDKLYQNIAALAGKDIDAAKAYVLQISDETQEAIDKLPYSASTRQLLTINNKLITNAMLSSVASILTSAALHANLIKREEANNYYQELARKVPANYVSDEDMSILNVPQAVLSNQYVQMASRNVERSGELAKAWGTDKGIFFDIARNVTLYRGIKNFTPLTDEQKATVAAMPAAYREMLTAANDELLAQLEANKKKTGYTIHHVDANVSNEDLFTSIISKFKGKVLLVDFWATWCGPCRMANKTMAPMKEELKDKDILYLYITGETSPLKTWENMIPDIHGEHFRLTDAQWKYLSDAFKIEGVPTYLIVDREGNTTFRQTGFPGVEKMKEELLKVTK